MEIRKETFRRKTGREPGFIPGKRPGRVLVALLSGVLFRARP